VNNFEKKTKLLINGLFLMQMLISLALPISTYPRLYSSLPTKFIRKLQTDDVMLPTSILPYPDGFSISSITPDIKTRIIGRSYREDCPVSLNDLRYVTILHIGFDGLTHQGELIVHKEIADIILTIFAHLYDIEYPLEKMQLIDEYEADDNASMASNNTSAFCFRPIAGTHTLSLHSYGLAIDINPLYNPYIHRETISPASSPYDKDTGTVPSPYFMTGEDPCVRLFKSYGFVWGGDWDSPKDYQHFEYRKTAAQ